MAHVGLLRSIYGFNAGILVHRLFVANDLGRFRMKPSLLADMLPFAIVPIFFTDYRISTTLVAMLFGIPALILLGASIEPRYRPLPLALGSLSYALYCIHEPLLKILELAVRHTPNPTVFGAFGLFCIIAFAVALERIYDERARAFLAMIVRGGRRAR
jgi:peptidoglycan/LPS O-acetylase OafA/YrhL